jgi:hypothetical protein
MKPWLRSSRATGQSGIAGSAPDLKTPAESGKVSLPSPCMLLVIARCSPETCAIRTTQHFGDKGQANARRCHGALSSRHREKMVVFRKFCGK